MARVSGYYNMGGAGSSGLMPKLSASVTRKDANLTALHDLADDITAKGRVVVKECADIIYKQSQDLVPVETGTLKASGRVLERGFGMDAYAVVGYGRTDHPPGVFKVSDYPSVMFRGLYNEDSTFTRVPSEYAVYVHQIPKNRTTPGTTHDFLQIPAGYNGTAWAPMRQAIKRIMGI